jgi:hypothetical protein
MSAGHPRQSGDPEVFQVAIQIDRQFAVPPFDKSLIRHPHIVSSWTTIRVERSRQKFVLQVTTDLAINAMDPIHGEPAVCDLLGTIRKYLEHHPIIDSAEINSVADA